MGHKSSLDYSRNSCYHENDKFSGEGILCPLTGGAAESVSAEIASFRVALEQFLKIDMGKHPNKEKSL